MWCSSSALFFSLFYFFVPNEINLFFRTLLKFWNAYFSVTICVLSSLSHIPSSVKTFSRIFKLALELKSSKSRTEKSSVIASLETGQNQTLSGIKVHKDGVTQIFQLIKIHIASKILIRNPGVYLTWNLNSILRWKYITILTTKHATTIPLYS